MNINKEILEELYLIKKMSVPKIAKHLNSKNSTIYRKLRLFNIPRRSMSEAKTCNKKNLTKDLLLQLYDVDKLSIKEICKKLNYSAPYIAKKLTEFGIEIKARKNSMEGRSVYSIWLDKYGKEKADILKKERGKKMSLSRSGRNNPMYGKRSPIGSGGGWSGWYKGWYFRSLIELSFMINVIERFNFKWEKGEQKKYTIEYINEEGKDSTYRPDFILNEKYMIEVKPKKLWNTSLNKTKFKSAKYFCKVNNLKFKIIDPINLDIEETIKMYKDGMIKFTKKWDQKINKLINERS